MPEPRYDFAVEPPSPPPPKRESSPRYQNMLRAMETPGEWCKIATYPGPSQARKHVGPLRQRKKACPPGRWEFRSGRIGDDASGLYARYLGPESENEH